VTVVHLLSWGKTTKIILQLNLQSADEGSEVELVAVVHLLNKSFEGLLAKKISRQ